MVSAKQSEVAVATTSQIAADAARDIAELGGNAVDCGIAASMCSINTQPGVCALAGGAFVTVWPPGQNPVTIDGNVAVPGSGLTANKEPQFDTVTLDYGGGVTTLAGPASVAVPGTLAALHLAAERYGKIAWRDLLQPSIEAAAKGFPLASACHHYLQYSGVPIFGRSDDGFKALHTPAGNLRETGSAIVVPYLADSLDQIAREGPEVFYRGDIANSIVSHLADRGGLLTRTDLAAYEPLVRNSLTVDIGDWSVATNPPPAIGGASLAAMLQTFGTQTMSHWDQKTLQHLVETQNAVLSYRLQHLDNAADIDAATKQLLDAVSTDDFISRCASGATVHTSAVDRDGLACSITASSGYGAGEMPASTGLWLNNCLGELELNQRGLAAAPPGSRLPSNMAPSAARRASEVLAMGSPGADRITTALHQFLVNFVQLGLDLGEAVAHPRMHLKLDGPNTTLAVEPGLEQTPSKFPVTAYDDKSMYFGGVAAALLDDEHQFVVAADPRREGGTYIGPALETADDN